MYGNATYLQLAQSLADERIRIMHKACASLLNLRESEIEEKKPDPQFMRALAEIKKYDLMQFYGVLPSSVRDCFEYFYFGEVFNVNVLVAQRLKMTPKTQFIMPILCSKKIYSGDRPTFKVLDNMIDFFIDYLAFKPLKKIELLHAHIIKEMRKIGEKATVLDEKKEELKIKIDSRYFYTPFTVSDTVVAEAMSIGRAISNQARITSN